MYNINGGSYTMKYMIYNLKDKPEYIEEIALLTEKEWGKYKDKAELEFKVRRKIDKISKMLKEDKINYCKLILVEENNLIGFISIFPEDGEEEKELTPWYATMFVKKEYRGMGYSKILNFAILEEAKRRGFDKIYLKSNLVNYYEKFGAKYIKGLQNGEKLYVISLV